MPAALTTLLLIVQLCHDDEAFSDVPNKKLLKKPAFLVLLVPSIASELAFFGSEAEIFWRFSPMSFW